MINEINISVAVVIEIILIMILFGTWIPYWLAYLFTDLCDNYTPWGGYIFTAIAVLFTIYFVIATGALVNINLTWLPIK